jgi:glycosyltransferase involved in cell wall biosynthesis
MTSRPLRILLSAYQCGPGMGSVSQIGWEWYSRLSRLASVTLVTHVRNRECLQAAGAPLPGSEVVYIDTEWFAGPLHRLASRLFPKSEHAVILLSSADFFVFDAVAVKQLRKRRGDWDLAHAVTPVSPVAATRLHRLGIPLIVGPWNGGLASPRAFPELMEEDSSWIYRIRFIGKVLDLLLGCTRKDAPIERMLENGVDLDRFQSATWDNAPSKDHPLNVLFVGRLLPFKGVTLLLEAISRVRADTPVTLTIVGDGPIRGDLEQRAAELNLNGIVDFQGNLPLDEVAERMRRAHVFCLPSIRESGGAVLLEAAASGLPVVAVNYGGPAELVDEEVGRLVSADGPEQLTAGLVDTFRHIAQNPEQWRQRGQKGRQRAEKEYGWEVRMRSALAIYRRVLGEDKAHA